MGGALPRAPKPGPCAGHHPQRAQSCDSRVPRHTELPLYAHIGALGFTNVGVYEETPDFLISRLSRVPIQPVSFNRPDVTDHVEPMPRAAETAKPPAEPALSSVVSVETDAIASPGPAESSLESRLQAAGEPKNPPEGGTPTDTCVSESRISMGCEEPDPARLFFVPASPSVASSVEGETSACEQPALPPLEPRRRNRQQSHLSWPCRAREVARGAVAPRGRCPVFPFGRGAALRSGAGGQPPRDPRAQVDGIS